MGNPQDYIDMLFAKGYKKTKIREALINHLGEVKKPLDVLDIRKFLQRKKLPVNKSTVYREIDFLLAHEVIVEINFGDGRKRYEIAGLPHHHHAVCNKCQRIEDIFIENDLTEIEKKIEKEKSFLIQSHSLEFFGLCKSCI